MKFLTIKIGSWFYSASQYSDGFILLETRGMQFHNEREIMAEAHFFDGWLPRMVRLIDAK